MKSCKLLLFFWIGLSSCGIYRQNVVNVPMVQQKGQLQIGGYESFSGHEAQASYSLTNKIAFMANYNNMGERRNDYSDINYSIDRHYFGELGLGVFKKATAESKGKISELFFIAGKGMTSHFVQGLDSSRKIIMQSRQVSYSRFCMQADLGKSFGRFSFAVSPRLLLIHYYDITDTERSDYKDLVNSYIYFEIAQTVRYRIIKHITLSGQVCITFPLTDYSERMYNYYYDFAPFNASIGFIVNLNLFKSAE